MSWSSLIFVYKCQVQCMQNWPSWTVCRICCGIETTGCKKAPGTQPSLLSESLTNHQPKHAKEKNSVFDRRQMQKAAPAKVRMTHQPKYITFSVRCFNEVIKWNISPEHTEKGRIQPHSVRAEKTGWGWIQRIYPGVPILTSKCDTPTFWAVRGRNSGGQGDPRPSASTNGSIPSRNCPLPSVNKTTGMSPSLT